jgi:hypothetical protein
MKSPVWSRRLVTAALVGALSRSPPTAADLTFLSDDQTFSFELPPRWTGATRPDEERASSEHLISVRAQQVDGTATLQAVVDGGFRGRKYGSTLADLGPLEAIAQRLVRDELLNDVEAKSANVVSSEKVSMNGRYYLVRYMVDFKPRIAKIAVVQQRLYCLRVFASQPAKSDFFDSGGAVLADMEAIAESYRAVAVNAPCLDVSDSGRVPAAGACRPLRP